MISKNKTVNHLVDALADRREKLTDKRRNLHYEITEKYPYDVYGMKGEGIFEEKSKKLDEEIALLDKYISGMYDLIEIVEGGKA